MDENGWPGIGNCGERPPRGTGKPGSYANRSIKDGAVLCWKSGIFRKTLVGAGEERHLTSLMNKDSWNEVRATVQTRVDPAAFSSWIEPLLFDKIDLGTLYISSPTRFIADWVRRNFSSVILESARGFGVREVVINAVSAKVPLKVAALEMARASEPLEPAVTLAWAGSRANPQYTFENFIESASNRLALASARRALDSVSFNPLFIHSASGMGKTHLLQAFAGAIDSSRRVIYASADQFLYSYVKACKEHDNVRFRESYMTADVLIIDDLHFIIGKEGTARELFSIIESYISAGKQVVLAGCKSPYQMDGLDAGICSRIASGLVVDIQPAEFELRLAVAAASAKALDLMIPSGVLEFVAEKITSSVREVKGAVNRLSAHSVLMGEVLSVASCRKILADVLAVETKPVDIADIKRIVAEKWGVSVADIDSEKKSRQFVIPRQVAMFIAKNLTQKSLPVIGKIFGGRDHATVIYACKKVRELMTADARLEQLVRDAERVCNSL